MLSDEQNATGIVVALEAEACNWAVGAIWMRFKSAEDAQASYLG